MPPMRPHGLLLPAALLLASLAAPPAAQATPFLFGGVGTTVFAPGSSSLGSFDTEWMLAISMGAGVLVPAGERLAIRLQTRFLLPANPAGSGSYFGTDGSSFLVSGDTVIPQGDASLGLTYQLGP